MKALMVLSPENFRDEEYSIPRDRLEQAGVSVTVAGPKSGTYRGMLGMTAQPDILLEQVRVDDYDALIVVGGAGSPKHLWNDKKLLSMLKEAYGKNKTVAGICLSGAVLANAGILDGKNATVFQTRETVEIFRQKNVKLANKSVVVDGKIITADGPNSAEEFAGKILESMRK